MLLEQTERNGNFLSVKHGGICLESKTEKEGYELVEGEVDGEPYSKYIRKFAGVEGLITKIEWYKRDNFRGLHIRIKDGGETYILDLPFEKRPYDTFSKVVENIDFSKPVRFEAWTDTKNAQPGRKPPTAFVAKQDGQFIQWKYTRENMGDCPQAEQSKTTGKWNFDKQREWLLDRILNVAAPQVEAQNGFNEPQPEYDEPKFSGQAKAVGSLEVPDFPPSNYETPPDDDSSIPF